MVKKPIKIKIISVNTNDESKYGIDPNDVIDRLVGKIFTVSHVDDIGNIHLLETSLAIIPDVDKYEIVE